MSTAKETYKTNEAIIKQQIKMLQEALKKHSKLFKKNETHWGFVGDLGSVKSTLSELDGFMKSATVVIEHKDCADIVIKPTDNVITDRPYGLYQTGKSPK
jgi:hypothetical protein